MQGSYVLAEGPKASGRSSWQAASREAEPGRISATAAASAVDALPRREDAPGQLVKPKETKKRS